MKSCVGWLPIRTNHIHSVLLGDMSDDLITSQEASILKGSVTLIPPWGPYFQPVNLWEINYIPTITWIRMGSGECSEGLEGHRWRVSGLSLMEGSHQNSSPRSHFF